MRTKRVVKRTANLVAAAIAALMPPSPAWDEPAAAVPSRIACMAILSDAAQAELEAEGRMLQEEFRLRCAVVARLTGRQNAALDSRSRG